MRRHDPCILLVAIAALSLICSAALAGYAPDFNGNFAFSVTEVCVNGKSFAPPSSNVTVAVGVGCPLLGWVSAVDTDYVVDPTTVSDTIVWRYELGGVKLETQSYDEFWHTFQTKGTYTITYYVRDPYDKGPSCRDPLFHYADDRAAGQCHDSEWDANKTDCQNAPHVWDKMGTITVKVVEVASVDHESGGVLLPAGTSTPARTKVCAGIKPVDLQQGQSAGDIVVKAVLDPDPGIPESELPSNIVSWSGGSAVSEDQPLHRKVSKGEWAKHTLTACTCTGNDAASMLAYVIGASPGGGSKERLILGISRISPADGRLQALSGRRRSRRTLWSSTPRWR